MPRIMKDICNNVHNELQDAIKNLRRLLNLEEENICNDNSLYKEFIRHYLQYTNTIGGFILFPRHNCSINQLRGRSNKIQDRFDLTLEFIRRMYEKNFSADNNPLIDISENDKEFFKMFGKGKEGFDLLTEFSEFAQKVMCIDFKNPQYIQDARVYRVGVTNAADRGLDMYSNWGPAIQIKHLSLDIELAENIVNSVSSDRIVIVCKNAEKDVILSLLTQIGWKSKIQSIITEDNLIRWYEKALRGKYAKVIGEELLECLRSEIINEFPPINNIPEIIKDRHYERISTDLL